MKLCPKCSAKNDNTSGFCMNCGESLADVPVTQEGIPAIAGDFLNKAKEVASVGAQKAKEAANAGAEKVQKAMDNADKKAEAVRAKGVSAGGWDTAVDTPKYATTGDRTHQKGSNILVDQSEQVVATIGSNYLQNYLSGGGVGKGIGVLTKKRFYYKGKNFSGKGKGMTSTTEEGIVSIDDIAFTRFTYTRPIGLLVFAIVLTIAAIVLYKLFGRYDPQFSFIALAAALTFYILYFVNRHSVFLISFPGGGFAFDVHYYPIADIRDFQRQLHLLKDHIKEEAAV